MFLSHCEDIPRLLTIVISSDIINNINASRTNARDDATSVVVNDTNLSSDVELLFCFIPISNHSWKRPCSWRALYNSVLPQNNESGIITYFPVHIEYVMMNYSHIQYVTHCNMMRTFLQRHYVSLCTVSFESQNLWSSLIRLVCIIQFWSLK